MMETTLDWPRVGLLPVVRAAQAALTQGRGFSLVRLGDGEGAMLSHDAPHMGEEIALCLRIWFGDQAIDGDDRRAMARGLGPGDLVLVGAGVLGKAYVAGAARRGAVAIDMGSVFDGWAGIISREGRIGTGAEFSIAHLAQGGPVDEAMRERLGAYLAGTNIADGMI